MCGLSKDWVKGRDNFQPEKYGRTDHERTRSNLPFCLFSYFLDFSRKTYGNIDLLNSVP